MYCILRQSAHSTMECLLVWDIKLFCLNTALGLSTSKWAIFSLGCYQLGRKSALT